jgi:hypothetical protein
VMEILLSVVHVCWQASTTGVAPRCSRGAVSGLFCVQGAIVNIDGANDTSCRQLARSAGTPVCINSQLNKVRRQ